MDPSVSCDQPCPIQPLTVAALRFSQPFKHIYNQRDPASLTIAPCIGGTRHTLSLPLISSGIV